MKKLEKLQVSLEIIETTDLATKVNPGTVKDATGPVNGGDGDDVINYACCCCCCCC